MDFGEFSKYLVVAGLGAAGYYFYTNKNKRVTNPDEIDDEVSLEIKLRRMEEILDKKLAEEKRLPIRRIEEDDDV